MHLSKLYNLKLASYWIDEFYALIKEGLAILKVPAKNLTQSFEFLKVVSISWFDIWESYMILLEF